MLKIAAQLVSISDEQKILNRIVEGLITPTFGFKVAYFRLVEPDGSLDIYACAGTQGQYIHNPHYKLPPGVGISGEVIKTKQPIAISDVRHDERFYFKFKDLRDREGLVGMLTVPLLSGEKAIGVLSCYTAEPHDFSDAEISTIEQYADLAVGALINAQHLHDLDLLNQVSEELASEIEFDRILKIIVRRVRRIAGADGAVLYPYDPDKERFDLERVEADGIGKNELLAIKNRPRPGGVSMTVLQKGKLEVVNLQEAVDHQLIKPSTRDVLLKEGIQAFIELRLKGPHQAAGTLYLNFSHPERLPASDKLRPLGKLTYQAALAIERAREFERCKRESSLLAITAQVTANVQKVQKTWEVFLHAAMELTEADAGNISIIRPDGRYLEQIVLRGYPENYRYIPLEVGGRSIQGQVAYLKEPILIYNVEDDPRWSSYYHPGIPGTRSELAVPICTDDSDEREVIAIINLESKQESNFSAQDMELVKLLCIHIRIAIQSAGDYEQLDRRRELLQRFVDVARTITASLNRDDHLQTILEQTARLFKAYFATIQLKDGNCLRFEEVYPRDRYEQLIHEIPNGEMSLDGPGITVEAAWTQQPVLVLNTRTYPGFKEISDKSTQSELAVPLLLDGQLIGVLNVEHKDYAAFSHLDVEVMEWLAQLVVVALQQAARYERLEFPGESQEFLEVAAGGAGQTAYSQKAQFSQLPEKITPRELEVLDLIAKPMSNTEIARTLFLSPNTIKVHVKSILRKLDVHDRTERSGWLAHAPTFQQQITLGM
jgi:GAF domain-containing protein